MRHPKTGEVLIARPNVSRALLKTVKRHAVTGSFVYPRGNVKIKE